ncbi:hypothetical protein HAX54_017999 [Datura stramonium]|uniref:Uncharacterized protein n=1 Tax=Datura stramonium TaxID=4076 RepID=A0ABS8ULS2_DATST|nr:hypothetical protein [Datura stramonium]
MLHPPNLKRSDLNHHQLPVGKQVGQGKVGQYQVVLRCVGEIQVSQSRVNSSLLNLLALSVEGGLRRKVNSKQKKMQGYQSWGPRNDICRAFRRQQKLKDISKYGCKIDTIDDQAGWMATVIA